MGSSTDIRWIQRLSQYNKALKTLSEAYALNEERTLSKLEKQGLIQAFEYTHDLAWKVMRDFFIYQGNAEIRGSRDATREAFSNDLIVDGDNWMDMIKKRNLTSYTYNEEIAEEIYTSVIQVFYPLFLAFQKQMQTLKEKEQQL